MKLWLVCLAPWMVATVGLAAMQDAKVQMTHHSTVSGALRIDDICYVSQAQAKEWGWTVNLRGKEMQVATEGRVFRVPTIKQNNAFYLNLNDAGRYLGAKTEWVGDTFRFLGSIRDIVIEDHQIKFYSTVSIQPKLMKMVKPDRLVIDLVGAHLDMDPSKIKGMESWYRIGQYEPNIVRFVIEHPDAATLAVNKYLPTRSFEYRLTPAVQEEASKDPPPTDPNVDPSKLYDVSLPTAVNGTDQQSTITFTSSKELGAPPAIRYLSPTQIEVRFINGQVKSVGDFKLEGSKLTSKYSVTSDGASATFLFESTQPLAFTLKHSKNIVTLVLIKPDVANNTLKGKVIVLDAGHGGKDTGTHYGEITEKNVVLPITLEVAKELRKLGASVILTRSEDSYPTLGERADLANTSNADLFISIHINSNSVANSRSGGMTFYHMGSAVGRLMAECIQTELAKVTNIPTMGAWSDRRLYTNGLSVLRNTKMPAVLIELGFVNHTHDRKEMLKDDFKSRAAKAIVKGLQVFTGSYN